MEHTLQIVAIILRVELARHRVGSCSYQDKWLVTLTVDVQLKKFKLWATGDPFLHKPLHGVRDVLSFITLKKLEGGIEKEKGAPPLSFVP